MTTAASAVPNPASSPSPRIDAADPYAKRLGYAGLAPFLICAVLMWIVDASARPFVGRAMSSYAAVIVSFLGALHWGIGMRQRAAPHKLYTWGIVPALVAWIGVMMPPDAGLVVHGVMLVVCYGVDRKVYPAHGVAAWLKLRFRLSAIAALCCFVGAAGS